MSFKDPVSDPLAFLPIPAAAPFRVLDWAATPLGDPTTWSPALRTLLGLVLGNPVACCLFWGEALIALPNAAFPGEGVVLGQPCSDPVLRSALLGVLAGEGALAQGLILTPARDEAGRVVGVLASAAADAALDSALRDSEARLRRVQRIGRVGGFEIDLRTGRNARSAEYMDVQGLAARAAEERHADWVRRLHPEDRVRAERHFLAAIADHAAITDYAQEYRILTPEGATRWIAARARIERDSEGRALRMLGAHVDVTDLKRTEAALAESMQRSREVLESLGDMLFALDGEARIRFASHRALEMWGKGEAEVLGRDFLEVFPTARDTAGWAAVGATFQDRTKRHLCAPSGVFGRWFALDVHPAAGGGVTVAARDIEALRQAELQRRASEAALRASEARLRMAQDAGEVGTWEWDIVSGALHWSESCHRLHGTDPADGSLFTTWWNGIHPEDRPELDRMLRHALAGDQGRWVTEFRFRRRRDGGLRWIAGRGEVVRDAATGRAVLLRGVAVDVTERREADERQALLMRELDHRARNALAVVEAAVRMTPKENAEAFAQSVLGRIAALARAHTLLSNGGWQSVALRDLVRGEIAPFLAGAPPRARAEGPAVMLAPAAAQALSMALHELASNAAVHGALSAPAGRLALEWRMDDASRQLRLRWSETGGPAIPAAPRRRGFGSRVLEATVAGQLGGRLALDWRAEGLVCDIAIPLDRAFSEQSEHPLA